MRLARLQGLEREKIESEYEELCRKIAYYKELLDDEKKLMGVVKDELLEIKEKWGDERRTRIKKTINSFPRKKLVSAPVPLHSSFSSTSKNLHQIITIKYHTTNGIYILLRKREEPC